MTEPFSVFAARHVRKRMAGFQKDIDICLKPTKHPAKKKPTVAFSPALGTCCATLEYLTSLLTGRRKPRADDFVKYTKAYLLELSDKGTLEVLYSRTFRHATAHRGIVSGVLDERKTGRRIAWELSDSKVRPAIRIVAASGTVTDAPWNCPYTHRAEIHLGRLAQDIADSGRKYADDVDSESVSLDNFRNRMEEIFPRAERR